MAEEIVHRPEAEHADVAALRDAYAKLQGFSSTDNRSWVYWGEYHGFDRYDCWHRAVVGRGGSQQAYDLFLPWHRAYLLNFDHVARDQNEDAVLPWWDWTSPRSHEIGVPDAYAAEGDNPLASGPTPDMPDDPARRTRRFPGDPSELPSMDHTVSPPDTPPLPSINTILSLPGYRDFSDQIQNVHDYIHVWTGGVNPENPDEGGDMGTIPIAAFDPIFWAHHAMIDRLWYLWQLRHGVNNIPADYLDRVLAPFPLTVGQVLDISSLGYDYATSVAVSTAPADQGGP